MRVKVDAHHDGKSWCGRGIDADFFTQGWTMDDLLRDLRNLKEAAALHFEEALRRGEVLSLLLISETEVRRGKAAVGWRQTPCRVARVPGIRCRQTQEWPRATSEGARSRGGIIFRFRTIGPLQRVRSATFSLPLAFGTTSPRMTCSDN